MFLRCISKVAGKFNWLVASMWENWEGSGTEIVNIEMFNLKNYIFRPHIYNIFCVFFLPMGLKGLNCVTLNFKLSFYVSLFCLILSLTWPWCSFCNLDIYWGQYHVPILRQIPIMRPIQGFYIEDNKRSLNGGKYQIFIMRPSPCSYIEANTRFLYWGQY